MEEQHARREPQAAAPHPGARPAADPQRAPTAPAAWTTLPTGAMQVLQLRPSAGALLPLQRAVGNTAVQRLLPGRPTSDPSAPRVHRCGPVPCDCSPEERQAKEGGAASPVHRAVASGQATGLRVLRLTEAERAIDLTAPEFAGDPTLEAAFDNAPALRRGATGDPVKKVQRGLMDDGFVMPRSTVPGGPCDGIFGGETEQAVQAFQRKHGLGVDGVVGRQTLGRLDELSNATGGVGRGGGGAVQAGDTGFEIRGKHPGAAQRPGTVFFDKDSTAIDAEEEAKLVTLANPTAQDLLLRGTRSEDEDPALAAARVQAVSDRLAANGHTATRAPDPRPAAGEGRLVYRSVRAVEVVPAGTTPSTPDCSAGPVVPAPPPNAFTTANDRALVMLDAALARLASPTDEVRALVASLFRSAAVLPTVRSRLQALRRHLAAWVDPAQHRFHNECDGSCVGTIAYIDGAGSRPLTLCPIFMNEPDLDDRAGTLIHEGAHRERTIDADDHAYLFERVIAHLTQREALSNADSYLALVRNLEVPGSVAVGPRTPDVAGAGMTDPAELAATTRAIAFAEKWVSANDSELGSLYATIVESRPGGRWTNGYYEDSMRLVARPFGFTRPPALPTPTEQQAIAGIGDRVTRMLGFFRGPITFDRAANPDAPTSVGPGRRIEVGAAFFRSTPTRQVHQLLTAVLQASSTIPIDQQPKYQVMLDAIRRHFEAPAP